MARLLDEYWRAQARIGAQAAAQTLQAWGRLDPADVYRSGQLWLAFTLAVIRAARGQSRSNAIAFYRLYRALETGYTVAHPDVPLTVPENLPVGQLRDEWANAAQLPRVPEPDDSRLVTVEPFDWPELDDAAMDRAAVVSMVSTGLARAHTLVREAEEEGEEESSPNTSARDTGRGRLDDPEFLADLASAGRGAANAADREAIRSGRDLVGQASQRDRRVVGWARVTDGDPCHFCAMLASRGAIYKTQFSAATTSDGDPRPDDPEGLTRYHDGCHCQVVPIYSRNDFLNPEARRLSREWREVTRGTSGDESRRVWRQHIEGQRRARRTAENARLLRLAQEA
ncbi:VG15 protein [Streptomyces sp. 6N106]|uniref:VG15 protein n=1 Tax=Streptomyces sp. 6N106 TaxID=3457418 RepID=UPI003FD2EB98